MATAAGRSVCARCHSTGTRNAVVLLYGGVFSGPSDDGDLLTEFFLHAQGIPYRRVTDRDMEEWQFSPEHRLFLFPAGHYFGPTPDWALGGPKAQARLREAVGNGMNYLGICAGALAATAARYYPIAFSLRLTKAMPRWPGQTGAGVQFFTVRLSRRLARLARLSAGRTRVWYHNGPILRTYRTPLYTSLATFEPSPEEREQARGSFLFGKHLRGAPAVVQSRYGRGRVVLCSPHFEYGDGGVWDFMARLRGWLAEHNPGESDGDPLAPGQPMRQTLFDTLGGRWLEPLRASTNWRVLTALVKDLLSFP